MAAAAVAAVAGLAREREQDSAAVEAAAITDSELCRHKHTTDISIVMIN